MLMFCLSVRPYVPGEIGKTDLEKLVKDKEATEIKAAEQQRVSGLASERLSSLFGLMTP